MAELSAFALLRPLWLLALPALVLLILWSHRRQGRMQDPWARVIDPVLLEAMRGDGVASSQGPGPWAAPALALLTATLAVVALSGPSFGVQPVPPAFQRQALVVVMEVNRASAIADLAPNRLERARFKVRDLLALSGDRETALVVFAGSAHVVSPLTRDWRTIDNQLPALEPGLLPTPGARVDLGLAKAADLLRQAGMKRGDIVLMSSGPGDTPAAAIDTARALAAQGYRLHIIGLGNDEGGPIPKAGGGFVLDANGAIRISKLNDAGLEDLAGFAGGSYRRLAVNDADIQAILEGGALEGGGLDPANRDARAGRGGREEQARELTRRRDDGIWLLPFIALLGLAAFRRRSGGTA
ncbi:MAG: VWA domain-containing protein [Gammaproteobacteria bacterium]